MPKLQALYAVGRVPPQHPAHPKATMLQIV